MVVIPEPEPETRTVLLVEQIPAIVGQPPGTVNYLCGNCGVRLAEGILNASQLQGLVIRCPRCKGHNETRA